MKSAKRATPRSKKAPAERVPMSFRVTPEFKERLDAWAAASGRSLAQEIELRLEQSDRGSGNLVREALEVAYGAQGAGLLLIMGKVLQTELIRSGGTLESDWLNDRAIFDRVSAAITRVLSRLQPQDGERRTIPGETAENAVDRFFIGLTDEGFFPMAPWRERMNALFGPAVMKRLRQSK